MEESSPGPPGGRGVAPPASGVVAAGAPGAEELPRGAADPAPSARAAAPPSARPERVGDCVLAIVICIALSVPPLVRVAAQGGMLRDDTPRPPRFRRLQVDPNVAPVGLLPALPGVGPVLAARIDEARRRMPFRDADDLLRVHGIGPATLEALRPHVRCGPTRTSRGP